ncbi:hypothetical protein [Okeania sp. SIO3B5]|nr:hypothetical protein [Okeania sp. SIO3B5]
MIEEGRRQKAEGRRKKAEGRGQKAEGKVAYGFKLQTILTTLVDNE